MFFFKNSELKVIYENQSINYQNSQKLITKIDILNIMAFIIFGVFFLICIIAKLIGENFPLKLRNINVLLFATPFVLIIINIYLKNKTKAEIDPNFSSKVIENTNNSINNYENAIFNFNNWNFEKNLQTDSLINSENIFTKILILYNKRVDQNVLFKTSNLSPEKSIKKNSQDIISTIGELYNSLLNLEQKILSIFGDINNINNLNYISNNLPNQKLEFNSYATSVNAKLLTDFWGRGTSIDFDNILNKIESYQQDLENLLFVKNYYSSNQFFQSNSLINDSKSFLQENNNFISLINTDRKSLYMNTTDNLFNYFKFFLNQSDQNFPKLQTSTNLTLFPFIILQCINQAIEPFASFTPILFSFPDESDLINKNILIIAENVKNSANQINLENISYKQNSKELLLFNNSETENMEFFYSTDSKCLVYLLKDSKNQIKDCFTFKPNIILKMKSLNQPANVLYNYTQLPGQKITLNIDNNGKTNNIITDISKDFITSLINNFTNSLANNFNLSQMIEINNSFFDQIFYVGFMSNTNNLKFDISLDGAAFTINTNLLSNSFNNVLVFKKSLKYIVVVMNSNGFEVRSFTKMGNSLIAV